MADPRATIILDGDVGPLRQKLREGVAHVNKFGDEARSAGDGATRAFGGFSAALGGLATVVSVGAMAHFIKEQIDFQDQMDESAQKAGIATQAMSEWTYVAKFSSLETDDMVKVFAKLSGSLADAKSGQKEAVEIFSRFKLDPKNIKDADDLLMQLADRFSHMPDGVDKSALAIDMFGEKLGPRLLPLLNAGREGIAQLRQEAVDFGVAVSDQAGSAAAKFNDDLDRMAFIVKGVGLAIATQLLPDLQKLVEWLIKAQKEGGIANNVLERMKQNALHFTVGDKYDQANQQLRYMQARIEVLVNEMTRLQDMVDKNPKSMLEATIGPDGHVAMLASERIKQLRVEYDQLQKAYSKVSDKFNASLPPVPDRPQEAGAGRGFINRETEIDPTFVPGAKKPTPGPAAKSQMPGLEAALAEQMRVLAILGDLTDINKQRELSYWQTVSRSATLSADDRLAVSRKVSQLEVEIQKEAAGRTQQIEQDSVQAYQALELAKLDGKRAAARALLDNNEITKQQELGLEAQFETERYNIQLAALQQRMQLLAQDPTTNAVELARIKDQMLLIEQQYQNNRMNIATQMAQESGLTSVFENAASSAGNQLDGLLTKTQSWGQAMASVYASVRQQFIKSMVTEPLAAWAAGQARMLAIKLATGNSEAAIQQATSQKTVSAKSQEALSVVGANAAEAGSGGASAMASIPYVGPILAIAAMAALFAAVMGMGRSVKSARGGFDIPKGINPMTQLHEEEMVLPKGPAGVIRQLAENGMGSSSGDSMVVNFHDNSGTLTEAEIDRKATKIANALNKLHRNGWRPAR